MEEFFPVAAGVLVGLGIQQLVGNRLRSFVLVLASLVIGFLASWVSGELSVSWMFLLVDALQVGAAATLVVVLLTRLQQRWITRR